MENVERVEYGGKLIALIVRNAFDKEGLTFVTDEQSPMQLGIHIQKKGFKAAPHCHTPFDLLKNVEVEEIFYIEKGRMRVDLYTREGKKVRSVECEKGDIIVLSEGHSVECMEDTKFIEIKQGPYRGKEEKKYLDEK